MHTIVYFCIVLHMDNLFNVNQIAFMLKVHPLTIRRYIKEGKLKAVKIGGAVRVPESGLQKAIKELTPHPKIPVKTASKRISAAKSFTSEDPFLQMEGRGASIGFHKVNMDNLV